MKLQRRILCAATVGLAMLAPGCASQNDVQQLNKNEFTLRSMIASDHQEIDALQQQIRRLNDKLTEMEHQDESSSGGTDESQSVGDRLNRLESEVTSLQAGMAAVPGAPPPPANPAAGAPVAASPPAVEASAPSAPPPPAAPPAEIAPTWPAELDAEIESAKSSSEPGAKFYSDGLDAMKDGKYPLAVARFTKLQHKFPKSALSEPAEYFAANALYETGKYDQAILQFNDLVMRYPKGRFSCAALLREAQAFLKLNDRIDARLTLQKLSTDCGGSPQAVSAGVLMKDLGRD
ncbi:MAG TPA: outer membrane protein assembly factor BamD [Candidatus Binataceae bacterium]|nr:outer membrane protein assembly factor BamD [Candidatus Binataceae bacterium]